LSKAVVLFDSRFFSAKRTKFLKKFFLNYVKIVDKSPILS